MPGPPIFVFPHNSKETFVTLNFGRELTAWARQAGIEPIVLGIQQARRPQLESALAELPDDETGLLIYAGHGTPVDLNGSPFLERPWFSMVQLGENESWLARDLIVCTVACDALSPLGETIVAQGGRAFIGSTENMFVNFKDLDEDGLADIVETFLGLGIALLQRRSVMDAVQEFQALCVGFIRAEQAQPDPDRPYIDAMDANLRLTWIGDGSARWGNGRVL